jgi:RimJ/RimL family protein N-acetyltransferase
VADFLAFHQGLRDTWRPETWNLELAVLAGGQPLGFQGVRATDFASRRSVRSGSWLGQRFQGQGYGTEMRAAVLHFAFVGLGAVEAATEAMDFNLASQRVSEKLGYTYDDEAWPVVRDRPQRAFNYHLTRDAFLSRPDPAVEIEGLEHCLSLFGADG